MSTAAAALWLGGATPAWADASLPTQAVTVRPGGMNLEELMNVARQDAMETNRVAAVRQLINLPIYRRDVEVLLMNLSRMDQSQQVRRAAAAGLERYRVASRLASLQQRRVAPGTPPPTADTRTHPQIARDTVMLTRENAAPGLIGELRSGSSVAERTSPAAAVTNLLTAGARMPAAIPASAGPPTSALATTPLDPPARESVTTPAAARTPETEENLPPPELPPPSQQAEEPETSEASPRDSLYQLKASKNCATCPTGPAPFARRSVRPEMKPLPPASAETPPARPMPLSETRPAESRRGASGILGARPASLFRKGFRNDSSSRGTETEMAPPRSTTPSLFGGARAAATKKPTEPRRTSGPAFTPPNDKDGEAIDAIVPPAPIAATLLPNGQGNAQSPSMPSPSVPTSTPRPTTKSAALDAAPVAGADDKSTPIADPLTSAVVPRKTARPPVRIYAGDDSVDPPVPLTVEVVAVKRPETLGANVAADDGTEPVWPLTATGDENQSNSKPVAVARPGRLAPRVVAAEPREMPVHLEQGAAAPTKSPASVVKASAPPTLSPVVAAIAPPPPPVAPKIANVTRTADPLAPVEKPAPLIVEKPKAVASIPAPVRVSLPVEIPAPANVASTMTPPPPMSIPSAVASNSAEPAHGVKVEPPAIAQPDRDKPLAPFVRAPLSGTRAASASPRPARATEVAVATPKPPATPVAAITKVQFVEPSQGAEVDHTSRNPSTLSVAPATIAAVSKDAGQPDDDDVVPLAETPVASFRKAPPDDFHRATKSTSPAPFAASLPPAPATSTKVKEIARDAATSTPLQNAPAPIAATPAPIAPVNHDLKPASVWSRPPMPRNGNEAGAVAGRSDLGPASPATPFAKTMGGPRMPVFSTPPVPKAKRDGATAVSSDPKSRKALSKRLLAEARQFLAKDQPDQAEPLVNRAKQLNVSYSWLDDTPQSVEIELSRTRRRLQGVGE